MKLRMYVARYPNLVKFQVRIGRGMSRSASNDDVQDALLGLLDETADVVASIIRHEQFIVLIVDAHAFARMQSKLVRD
jgi:hypothetical protein